MLLGNGFRRSRLFSVWRRVLSLSWPVSTQQVFQTLIRTTDVFVVGLFSPAAIAALGLADLYARLPLRIGHGLGGGAIALSSQDTGSDATANRDEAITQAIFIGFLVGVPFVLFGLAFGDVALAVLGASPEVAAIGGTYLAIILTTAPARHVAMIGGRSLQGTGDTRTPMYINVASNALNIVGSVVLGLGLGPVPRLEIVGVGLATAFGNLFTATAMVAVIWGPSTDVGLERPADPTITRQLVAVSAPRVGEGLAATIAEFPFNAILLGFGTEVNAGYQVARRIIQQVTAPLSRGYNVAASVVVGQALGEGDPDRARFEGRATAALGLATVGTIGFALFFGANTLVPAFSSDSATVRYAVEFTQLYGLIAPFMVLYIVFAGALQGGSETRAPFVVRTTGMFGFMVGLSYVVGVVLEYGVFGVYVGSFVYYVWLAVVLGASFYRRGWTVRATEMMAERGSISDDAGEGG
jgi:putative MATE family efflux protein